MCFYGVPGQWMTHSNLWNTCGMHVCIALSCHLHNTLFLFSSIIFNTICTLTSGYSVSHYFKLLIDQLSSLIQFEHDKSHSCTISWRVSNHHSVYCVYASDVWFMLIFFRKLLQLIRIYLEIRYSFLTSYMICCWSFTVSLLCLRKKKHKLSLPTQKQIDKRYISYM